MMSDAKFRRLVSGLWSKKVLREKYREEAISGQHLVSGKLTVDRNFSATQ